MTTKDPQKKHPNPHYPQPIQEPPGSERDMSPKADHGAKSYKGNNKLKGRVALITGGDSGIGRAVAIAFARAGADLLISYLSEDEDAEDTANLVEKEGRRCVTVAGDISEEKHCIALIDQCVGELGRLDVLVNNAAHQRTKEDIQHFTSREFKYTFETNVYAMFYLCKAALPHLQPGSSIINVASIQAYQPSANLLAYAATKGAIVTFTKALSDMAIEKGVRVNAVAPGPIWTPLIPSTMSKRKVKQFGKNTPMGRAGQPAELAPAFVFLASQDSSYITGEVLGVTGERPLS
jgi:NAD(P)-dependent dehydrogenase (short-subunit alcohol dehydrogenase family)